MIGMVAVGGVVEDQPMWDDAASSSSIYTNRSTSSDERATSAVEPSSHTDHRSGDDGASGFCLPSTSNHATTDGANVDNAAASQPDSHPEPVPTGVAAAEPEGAAGGEDWDQEVADQPQHTFQGRLFRMPQLQEIGVRTQLVPQVREAREMAHVKEIAITTERAAAEVASNYTDGLEMNCQYYRELARQEFQYYISTGDEPSQRLRDWIADMDAGRVHHTDEPLQESTLRDVIANNAIVMNHKEDENESLREEVARLRRLLNQTTTELHLTRRARDMSYEMRRREADRREEDLGDDLH